MPHFIDELTRRDERLGASYRRSLTAWSEARRVRLLVQHLLEAAGRAPRDPAAVRRAFWAHQPALAE